MPETQLLSYTEAAIIAWYRQCYEPLIPDDESPVALHWAIRELADCAKKIMRRKGIPLN